jgi:hypothetical protein
LHLQNYDHHWPEFQRTYLQRYQKRYGPWRPIIDADYYEKYQARGGSEFEMLARISFMGAD